MRRRCVFLHPCSDDAGVSASEHRYLDNGKIGAKSSGLGRRPASAEDPADRRFAGSPEDRFMQTALRQLFLDFLSAIVFLILYAATDNLWLATGVVRRQHRADRHF